MVLLYLLTSLPSFSIFLLLLFFQRYGFTFCLYLDFDGIVLRLSFMALISSPVFLKIALLLLTH